MPASRWSRSLKLALIPFLLISLTLWFLPQHAQRFIPTEALPDISHHLEHFYHDVHDATTPTNHVELPPTSPNKPAFHLLVSNAKRSPALCRSLLSATILNYPPPILINYEDDSEDQDEDATDSAKDSDMAEVNRFLKSPDSGLSEDDTVLVVDGRSTFFHLPASVMLRRLQTTHTSSNAWAVDEYGSIARFHPGRQPRFEQRVLLGASEQCPLRSNHSACKAPPASPIRGHDRAGLRYPDGGAAIGRAADMRAVYGAAAERSHASGTAKMIEHAKDTMAKLFADQERMRKSFKASILAFFNRKGLDHQSSASDFGLGLDYGASLFMTATGLGSETASQIDMRHLSLNGLVAIGGDTSKMHLPDDLCDAARPFRPTTVADAALEADPNDIARVNDELDALPESLGWGSVPLATSPLTDSVPAAIHLAPLTPTSTADAIWRSLWFYEHSRAMLRNVLRRLKSPAAVAASSAGGSRALNADTRGGHAGFWTADGAWRDFDELCVGFGAEVFGDGRGEWGWETGRRPVCNVNWELVSGEGDCDELREEAARLGIEGEEALRSFRQDVARR